MEKEEVSETTTEKETLFVLPFKSFTALITRPELNNLGCSYNGKFEYQIWFNCKTCFPMDESKGVCLGCAKTCSLAHHEIPLEEFKYNLFYCDLGHTKAGSPEVKEETEKPRDYLLEEIVSCNKILYNSN